jgi:hypothetical protein
LKDAIAAAAPNGRIQKTSSRSAAIASFGALDEKPTFGINRRQILLVTSRRLLQSHLVIQMETDYGFLLMWFAFDNAYQ